MTQGMMSQPSISGFAKALQIIELWFAPWGAAKGARWEELSGGRGCDPHVALEMIRDALTGPQTLTDLSMLADFVAVVEWYADVANWTERRPAEKKVVSIETGSLAIEDRSGKGLTLAVLDVGQVAREVMAKYSVIRENL